ENLTPFSLSWYVCGPLADGLLFKAERMFHSQRSGAPSTNTGPTSRPSTSNQGSKGSPRSGFMTTSRRSTSASSDTQMKEMETNFLAAVEGFKACGARRESHWLSCTGIVIPAPPPPPQEKAMVTLEAMFLLPATLVKDNAACPSSSRESDTK